MDDPDVHEAPADRPMEEPTRRRLLRGGLILAGAAVAGVAARPDPAEATDGQPVVLGQLNTAANPTVVVASGLTAIVGQSQTGSLPPGQDPIPAAVSGHSLSMPGVAGLSTANCGVFGSSTNFPGVVGQGVNRPGVAGTSVNGPGIEGTGQGGVGVLGLESSGALDPNQPPFGAGVFGLADDGVGVVGQSLTGVGVRGISDFGAGLEGVSVEGPGVFGRHTDADVIEDPNMVNLGAGVFGLADDGVGVVGSGVPGGSATGVAGIGAGSGFGIRAQGGLMGAQLMPVPKLLAGPPADVTSHGLGEVWVDAAGVFWYCTAAGEPGTWSPLASPPITGGSVNLLAKPIRLFDSRSGAPLVQGATVDVQVTGVVVGGVSVPAGAVGVVGNVTVTQTQAPHGYLTLYAEGSPPSPATSNVNWFGADQNLNAAAIVRLNPANGKLTIHNGMIGGSHSTHVVFDASAFVI